MIKDIIDVSDSRSWLIFIILLSSLWYCNATYVPKKYGFLSTKNSTKKQMVEHASGLKSRIEGRSEDTFFVYQVVDYGLEEYTAVLRMAAGPNALDETVRESMIRSFLFLFAALLFICFIVIDLCCYQPPTPVSYSLKSIFYTILILDVFITLSDYGANPFYLIVNKVL